MTNTFLLYGSYGYTGQLILELALSQGIRPILGGRNASAVTEQAKRHGLESRVFDVADKAAAATALRNIPAVLSAAGPFRQTALPMAQACLETGTHYLDVTGEIDVFETLAQQDQAARRANVMLLPGVGFDVVPTDCVAAHLKSRLPDATQLTLAFQGLGGLSRGTATTALESMTGGAVRRDGRIVTVPAAWKTGEFDFGKGPRLAVTIPWGDVSTAYYSTGIGNIDVYTAVPPTMIKRMRMTRYLGWILRLPPIQQRIKQRIKAGPPGPDAATRQRSSSVVWGEVRNTSGRRAAARLHTPNGYTLTAMTALRAAQEVVAGKAKPGFQTPSRAFGADFVLQFPGVSREDAP